MSNNPIHFKDDDLFLIKEEMFDLTVGTVLSKMELQEYLKYHDETIENIWSDPSTHKSIEHVPFIPTTGAGHRYMEVRIIRLENMVANILLTKA